MSEQGGWGYSRGQIVASSILLGAIAMLAAVEYWQHPALVSDPQPLEPIHAKDLADRIDPNVADVATLSALPMVGEKRAREIVEYRDRIRDGDSSKIVFRNPDDLLRLRGFGVAMVSQLKPYLLFPTTTPATQTSG